jgi:adhesin/invasin
MSAQADRYAGDDMRVTGAIRLIAVGVLLAGCGGGGDLLLPGAGEPAAVTLLQGDDQNGRVGEALPQPLVAAVTDGAGRPVEGATVVFVLTDPAPGASIDPDTVKTDADGNVTAAVVLGTRPGAQAGEVRALGGNGTPTATTPFTLTALSENANGVHAVSGADQSAPVGSALGQPLVVEVSDAFGNPIPGVEVAWTVEGGGSVSADRTTTGGDGRTSVERTLGGTAGTQRTLASVDGLAGSPVAFVHTATAGAASGVTIVSGDDQAGPVSTELPQDLVVQVRDAQSNAVPGIAVTWVIGTGGGSVTPATSATDANGRATATWTMGASPGANTVSAVVSGIGVAEFSATATAGAPARLSVRTPPSSSAISGVVLPQQPVIQLLDAQGNEAKQSGVEVSVSIASGGGALGGTTSRLTDGDGRAAFSGLSLSGSAGTRTLRFAANGFASVTSPQIDLGAAPSVTTITADSPDPSQTGEQVTVQFTVTAATGTPEGSVRVSDGSDQCTGPLSGGQGSCTLALSTAGSRTLTAEYPGNNGFAASSGTAPHTVAAPPTLGLRIAQQPSSGVIGQTLAPSPAVQLQSGSVDVGTAGISVSVALASGGGTLSGTTTVVTDAQGRAEFGDLAVNGDAGQRTLVFTAGSYGNVTSGPIDVAAPPAPGLSITQEPASGTLGAVLSPAPAVQLLSGGAPAATPGVNVTVTIGDGGGTLSGTTTVPTDAQGHAAFTDLVITGDPGPRTLVFAADGYPSATSTSFDVQ